MVKGLVLFVAEPGRDFFRLADQIPPAPECTVVPTTDTSNVGHIGLGQLGVLPIIWCGSEDCDVKWRG